MNLKENTEYWILPEDDLAGVFWNRHLGRKNESFSPIHHFAVRLLRILTAKRRVADQHFVHNHAQAPPIASRTVTRLHKHFRRDVIRRTDRATF